jgi:hypothetical protein
VLRPRCQVQTYRRNLRDMAFLLLGSYAPAPIKNSEKIVNKIKNIRNFYTMNMNMFSNSMPKIS